MYLSATLASETLSIVSRLCSTHNELCRMLDHTVLYLSLGGDEASTWAAYPEEERKEHLARCTTSLKVEIEHLSHLYPIEDLQPVFQQASEEIQAINHLLSQYSLSQVVYVPGVGGSDALQSQVANLSIFDLISAVAKHVQNITPLSGHQSKLITHELIKRNSQAAIQQIFTLFEDRLRKRISVGPELFGESLINTAFGNHGALIYGQTPAEQIGIRNLISGAYATFRNPYMHRMIEDDEKTTLAIITMVDLLIKIIDEAQLSQPIDHV